MPETPEELYERVKDSLRMPPVEEWDTFPFDGELTPRRLLPPVEKEEPRFGEGGVDCRRCAAGDDDYIWTSERWRLHALDEPSGLPVVVLLEPREHFSEPGDLPVELAAELGVMLGRVERAIRSIGEIGRVHVCRWGDGSEHLHWWFLARPAPFRNCSEASPRSGKTSSHRCRRTGGARTSPPSPQHSPIALVDRSGGRS